MEPSGPLLEAFFSTDDVPEPERFDTWRALISGLFDVSPLADPRTCSAMVQAWRLGSLRLALLRLGAQRGDRSRHRAAADGVDDYLLDVCLGGGVTGETEHGSFVLTPGEVQVLDASRPAHVITDGELSLSLSVPRELLDALLPHADALHGYVLRGGLGELLSQHMQALARCMPHMDEDEARQAARASLNVVAACFAPTAARLELASKPLEAALLERARQQVEAQLETLTLSPLTLCASLHVSRSYLYHLFEPLGGVAAYIRERRLVRARWLLGAQQGHTVSGIAFSCGFRSAAQFSRAFRQRFGYSPSATREAIAVDPSWVRTVELHSELDRLPR